MDLFAIVEFISIFCIVFFLKNRFANIVLIIASVILITVFGENFFSPVNTIIFLLVYICAYFLAIYLDIKNKNNKSS